MSQTMSWPIRLIIIAAIVVVLLVILFFGASVILGLAGYKTYTIPGEGMADGLLLDEVIVADLAAYDSDSPRVGEVLVFLFPGDGKTLYVKRCVALPGDTVEIVDKQLYVNNEPEIPPTCVIFIDTTLSGEPVLRPRSDDGRDTRDNFGPYVVPAGHFFVLGDNRDNSYDSRYWGAVPRDFVRGRACCILYSSDWGRIGKSL